MIKRQGYFDPDQIEALKKRYSQKGFTINAPYEDDYLIIVLTFGILLDQFF
jgi:asparagine synthase (glutamine-hydrolysing)